MSALASSPELSSGSPSGSDEYLPASSAPKRKKRQNFSGLTPQQKMIAKKANNRQAAQNLRDRKKAQEVALEEKMNKIEASNERLAAQLAQLEQENKAIQDEARAFANEHIQRFQLQGLAQRLMGAVQTDPGNGNNIAALLAAMGKALENSPSTMAGPADPIAALTPAPTALSLDALFPESLAAHLPHEGADQDQEQEDEQEQQQQQQQQQQGEAGAEADMELASPPPGPVDLSDLPELPADLLLDLLPQSPPLVPDSDVLAALAQPLSLSLAEPMDASPGSSYPSFASPLPSSSSSVSPVPALPVLSQETVRSAMMNPTPRALERVQTSNSSAAAGAWPAVPPLPSGLQQLLMVLICTSLMRLPQAPASLAAAASPSGPVPSMTASSPLSKRQPGSSASARATRCSSSARCSKEYGLATDACSPSVLSSCVC